MTGENALPIKRPAALVLDSERIDGKPRINCMSYAACSVLRWGAYDVPTDFGATIRKATGVPDRNKKGQPQGIGFPDLKRGLMDLFPTAPILYGARQDEAGITALLPHSGMPNRHHAVFAVCVPHMSQLSPHLRRWCGVSYVDGHAFAIGAKQFDASGLVQWWWMDMNADTSKGYAGEWVYPPAVSPFLERNRKTGLIKSVYMIKGTAIA